MLVLGNAAISQDEISNTILPALTQCHGLLSLSHALMSVNRTRTLWHFTQLHEGETAGVCHHLCLKPFLLQFRYRVIMFYCLDSAECTEWDACHLFSYYQATQAISLKFQYKKWERTIQVISFHPAHHLSIIQNLQNIVNKRIPHLHTSRKIRFMHS